MQKKKILLENIFLDTTYILDDCFWANAIPCLYWIIGYSHHWSTNSSLCCFVFRLCNSTNFEKVSNFYVLKIRQTIYVFWMLHNCFWLAAPYLSEPIRSLQKCILKIGLFKKNRQESRNWWRWWDCHLGWIGYINSQSLKKSKIS